MIWLFTAALVLYLLLEVGCNQGPRIPGVPWDFLWPHLPISKKKRTRGDVNRDGLSKLQQARQ